MMIDLRTLLFALLCVAASACGGGQKSTTTPETVSMEEMHIHAKEGEGGYEFESFDAEGLFKDGVRLSQDGKCEEGVLRYDRVLSEFPSSRFVSPSVYNAGLCLQQKGKLDESAKRFETLITKFPKAPDVRHARFQVMGVYIEAKRWDDTLSQVDTVLKFSDLNSDERMEALTRRAQATFGKGETQKASDEARDAMSTRVPVPKETQFRDNYFLGAANYVVAETIRLKSEAVTVPVGKVETQRPFLEKRAQLLLDAQREYFNTMTHRDAHWAGAAGYQIGAMYDAFWNTIMTMPAPPPETAESKKFPEVFVEEYRKELAKLVKPLVRHAIRYWELTLQMMERTGAKSEWTEKIHADLDRARERLLQQPAGRGGLPQPPPAAEEPEKIEEKPTATPDQR